MIKCDAPPDNSNRTATFKSGAGDLAAAAADMARYANAGPKASGGEGDEVVGCWLEEQLRFAGYECGRHPFQTPWFNPGRAVLVAGDHRAEVVPQAPVVPTGPCGIAGPLALFGRDAIAPGSIALVDLPHGRWSTALGEAVFGPVSAAIAAGAAAVAIVTTGPSGDAIALNAPAGAPLFERPVVTLAPRDAPAFREWAVTGEPTAHVVAGEGGTRPAWNLVATLDRGYGRWLVVSTPRSGWFGCVGERGPGVAIWLALARWAGAALPDHDLLFLCTSGHEYENQGIREFVGGGFPSPDATSLWVTIGANAAARDWHDLAGGLAPLPSVDPQRFLVASPELMPHARAAFAGQPGLESPYSTEFGAHGELAPVLEAGYRRVAGVLGVHRFHHSPKDGPVCVFAPLIPPVTAGFRALIEAALSN